MPPELLSISQHNPKPKCISFQLMNHPNQWVSQLIMFYLKNYLLQLDGTTAVLEHKATWTEGRYSIMTTANTFTMNRTIIKDILATWGNEIIDNNGLDPLPCTNSMFQMTTYEDESNENTSYLSTCLSRYSCADISINKAPMNNGPTTQAWTALLSIPGMIEAITSLGISALSHDEYDRVTNNNARLLKEITE